MKSHTVNLDQLLNLPALSRRRDVRIEPLTSLHVAIPAARGGPTVKDISTRGLCILADSPLLIRSVHTLTLTLGRMTVTRRARVIHCHAHMTGGWFMGMEFFEELPNQTWTIEDLIGQMLDDSLSFS